MNYTVWLTEYSDPDHVWADDEQVVLADIRSARRLTVEDARVTLMQSTPEISAEYFLIKGYEVWIEMSRTK